MLDNNNVSVAEGLLDLTEVITLFILVTTLMSPMKAKEMTIDIRGNDDRHTTNSLTALFIVRSIEEGTMARE